MGIVTEYKGTNEHGATIVIQLECNKVHGAKHYYITKRVNDRFAGAEPYKQLKRALARFDEVVESYR